MAHVAPQALTRFLLTCLVAVAALPACGQDGDGTIEDPIRDAVERGDLRIGLRTIADGLTAPVWGTFAPGVREEVLFVADQTGILWEIDAGGGDRREFLDVRELLVDLSPAYDERGLLGVAFHPDYAENGRLYTSTSEPPEAEADFSTMPRGESPNHQSVLREWHVDEPGSADSQPNAGESRELLRIDQPQMNHNGGTILFGPDGLLYIPLGDGGAANDKGVGHVPGGNGQEPGNVFGTILRIDPTGSNSRNGKYGIPRDNPFVDDPDALNEVYAFGLRNPWGVSFDRETERLYSADVGQDTIEEVNLVMPGGNYGWPLREGTFAFERETGEIKPPQQRRPSLIGPIAQYDHDEGSSVIGGFVYRGSDVPDLQGTYVFGDYNGRLFYLGDPVRQDGLNEVREFRIEGSEFEDLMLLGFAEDARGELYVLANETGAPSGETGVVLKIASPRQADE